MLLALLLAIATPPKGIFYVDETGRVPAATLSAFNDVAVTVDASASGQLGLAVVRSTHGVRARQLATDIFNQWGIGHAGRNDGVLLFFALDDRKSEIVLGDGFSPQATFMTDAIMRDDVVANMKQQRLDQAILRAAASLSQLIKRTFQPATLEVEPPLEEHSPRGWTVNLGHALSASEAAPFDREGDLVYAAGKGMLFFAPFEGVRPTTQLGERLRRQLRRQDVWIVFASIDAPDLLIDAPGTKRIYDDIDRTCRRIEADAREQMRSDALGGALAAMHATSSLIIDGPPPKSAGELYEEHQAVWLGSFGTTGLLGLFITRAWWRRRPRSCASCGFPRHKLSEDTDDPHLNPGQRLEEQLGSVDYDVWWCGRCNDALVLRYGAIFTSYGTCDSCGFKTATSSSQTLVEATYDHGGTVEVTERCQNCPHVSTYTRHTSRLTRSDDSSSSSSWSSSSSDSSFGGGSSSGSGSSGSW